ncbi:transporter [Halocola ammonii]
MKSLIIFFSLLLSAFISHSQFTENIASGRPGQANGARTVGARTFQLQAGGGYNTPTLDNNRIHNYTADAVLRVGITERFEVGALWNYRATRYNFSENTFSNDGFASPAIRARVNLNDEQKGLLPVFAIQAGAFLPIGDPEFGISQLSPFGRLMASYSFFDRVGLTFNYRMNFPNSTDKPAEHRYIASLSLNITQKLGILGEIYGDVYRTYHVSKFDYGIFYLVNEDLQLDINAGGHTINEDSNPFFINAGVSWRISVWR